MTRKKTADVIHSFNPDMDFEAFLKEPFGAISFTLKLETDNYRLIEIAKKGFLALDDIKDLDLEFSSCWGSVAGMSFDVPFATGYRNRKATKMSLLEAVNTGFLLYLQMRFISIDSISLTLASPRFLDLKDEDALVGPLPVEGCIPTSKSAPSYTYSSAVQTIFEEYQNELTEEDLEPDDIERIKNNLLRVRAVLSGDATTALKPSKPLDDSFFRPLTAAHKRAQRIAKKHMARLNLI